jgi:hypothetical protein
VVQIWPGRFVCKQFTVCPGHIWTTLYLHTQDTQSSSINGFWYPTWMWFIVIRKGLINLLQSWWQRITTQPVTHTSETLCSGTNIDTIARLGTGNIHHFTLLDSSYFKYASINNDSNNCFLMSKWSYGENVLCVGWLNAFYVLLVESVYTTIF